MKIFVSWSGDQSKELAEAISEWLPNVIQQTQSFFSPHNIRQGRPWFDALGKELKETGFGILCITPENTKETWMLFEAGALWKGLPENSVCPIVFGMKPSELGDPLGQLQAMNFGKSEIQKLLVDINASIKEKALTDKQLETAFEKYWPDLDVKVSGILKKWRGKSPKVTKTSEEYLEEILTLCRSFQLASAEPDTNKFGFARYSDPSGPTTYIPGSIPLGSLPQPMGLLWSMMSQQCKKCGKTPGTYLTGLTGVTIKNCPKCFGNWCSECWPTLLGVADNVCPECVNTGGKSTKISA